jgi:hypothetical protein
MKIFSVEASHEKINETMEDQNSYLNLNELSIFASVMLPATDTWLACRINKIRCNVVLIS